MSHRPDHPPKSTEQQRATAVLRAEHVYQLALMHPETDEASETYGEAEEAIDPEHTRKLAAIRTELMERMMNAHKERK